MTSAHSAPTVSVHASAELQVPPDSFVLYANVSGAGADSAVALAELAARYARFKEVAGQLPESVDVNHGRLNSWNDAGKRGQAWHAQRTATLRGRDTAVVGAVAEALREVPGITLNGPEWELDRDNRAYGEVQQDAVEEARGRAERYAAALGGTLGRLVEISDPEAGGHLYRGAVAHAASARMDADLGLLDFGPQQVTISARVEARWYLVLPE